MKGFESIMKIHKIRPSVEIISVTCHYFLPWVPVKEPPRPGFLSQCLVEGAERLGLAPHHSDDNEWNQELNIGISIPYKYKIYNYHSTLWKPRVSEAWYQVPRSDKMNDEGKKSPKFQVTLSVRTKRHLGSSA